MAVDIDEELQIIKNEVGGSEVKDAIVSALMKISPTRGENIRLEFDHGLMLEAPPAAADVSVVGAAEDWYDDPTLVFTFTAIRTSNAGYVQMSEIYFYDSEQTRLTPTVTNLYTNGVTSWASEVVSKVVDDNINTKWCCQWVNPITLAISFDSDVRPAYISYVTGNDLEGRDPISFSVTYSHQETKKTILTVENATITTSRKTETQKFECSWE